MEQRIIGFVGKPYGAFIEWLLAHDYRVVCLVETGSAYSYPDGIASVYYLDFTKEEQFYEDLAQVKGLGISGLVATYENAVVAKSWACKALGLAGLSVEAAVCATDKYLMRRQFQTHAPEISPSYALVQDWGDVEAFLANHSFPLMLKPTNLFKSLLVTKSNNLEELKQNFQHSFQDLRRIYAKEKVPREAHLLIEEYMEGKCYSVEIFAQENGELHAISPVDLVMGRDLGIPDNYNYSRSLPSALSSQDQQALIEVAKKGVMALDFRATPTHVELIWTTAGPKIIEIGARVGGYRPRMYKLAFGVDLFEAQVAVALGKTPDLRGDKHAYCMVFELFSEIEGEFENIEGWEEILAVKSLYYASIKIPKGQKTGLSKDGYRAVAVIILVNNEREKILNDELFVRKLRVNVHY